MSVNIYIARRNGLEHQRVSPGGDIVVRLGSRGRRCCLGRIWILGGWRGGISWWCAAGASIALTAATTSATACTALTRLLQHLLDQIARSKFERSEGNVSQQNKKCRKHDAFPRACGIVLADLL